MTSNHPITRSPDPPIPLVLASSSPRRAEILTAMGIPFVVDAADVSEEIRPGESALDAASRLAADKAACVAERHPDSWVLAADTLVLLGEEILGKPRDDPDARRMLGSLAGREHRVVTAARLLRLADAGREKIETSRVRIAPLSPEEILWYVATGEPRDKAGAYAVQGLGARFIESVSGSYTNVMGLPARSVYLLLKESGDASLARLALSDSSSLTPRPAGP
ncbi:MAG TPA: Maf family protein [Thermoanaerobaculia bacterium]|nr:Maf family protein [Thermoanaerobaculia bacterium]